MYWFSMGRHVQMRPVLASITDQLVAGTGPTVVMLEMIDVAADFRTYMLSLFLCLMMLE